MAGGPRERVGVRDVTYGGLCCVFAGQRVIAAAWWVLAEYCFRVANTSGGGRPANLADLLTALSAFSALDPVERAAVAPALGDAARVIMAAERRQAMAEATDREQEGWITQRELARRLGINHNKVYLAIAQFRKER